MIAVLGLPVIGWAAAGAVFGGLFAAAGLQIPRRSPIVTPLGGWIYPCMMTAGGAGFALMATLGGGFTEVVAGCILLLILIALTVSDLTYRLLPNKIIYPAIVWCAGWRVLFHPLPLWEYALGFLIGGGMLYLVSFFAVKRGRPPMGGGDIKLMALLGLAMGAELIVMTLILSSLIGMLGALLLIAARRMNRSSFVPFGPFISLAAVIAWLCGDAALQWYYGLYP